MPFFAMLKHFFYPLRPTRMTKFMQKYLLLNTYICRQQSMQFWRPCGKLMRFEYSVTDKTDPEKQQSCQAVISNRQDNETYNRGQLGINAQ